MNWFPAKRRAFLAIILTTAVAVPCFLVGFPMPLAVVIGYIFSVTLTYSRHRP